MTNKQLSKIIYNRPKTVAMCGFVKFQSLIFTIDDFFALLCMLFTMRYLYGRWCSTMNLIGKNLCFVLNCANSNKFVGEKTNYGRLLTIRWTETYLEIGIYCSLMLCYYFSNICLEFCGSIYLIEFLVNSSYISKWFMILKIKFFNLALNIGRLEFKLCVKIEKLLDKASSMKLKISWKNLKDGADGNSLKKVNLLTDSLRNQRISSKIDLSPILI